MSHRPATPRMPLGARRCRARMSRVPILLAVFGMLAVPCQGAARRGPPVIMSRDTVGPLGALHWRLIGPFRAGRVLATAGVPGDPTTFYFGAVGGGVWKTVNAGVTWEPIFDDQSIASIGALALAPTDPDVIYVGTGEADMRSDITYGDGVYRSDDAGRHWTHVGLEATRHIGKLLVDPRDPNIVLVAALGHAYGPNRERGVYRSDDGGRTWSKVLYRDENTGAVDLARDPSNPDVVFATLWNARRTTWSQYPPEEGAGSGIWRSTDGGRTWSEITGHGLPTGRLGRIGVSVAPGGRRVWALIEATDGGGLYRSDDGGASWSFVSGDGRITTRGWYFGRVFADPKDADVVYLPNRGIVRSTDGGATFTTIKGSPGGDDYHYVWIDPQQPRHMIQGSDQGASISLDDGRTWSSWYNQPTAQFYHVAADSQFPYRLYGAQQDAGSVAISSRSDLGEITYRDWFQPGLGEAGYIAPNPRDPNIVYGGDTYGGVFRYDRRNGQVHVISPAPAAGFATPLSERKYRFTWTSPIVFDPHEPSTLYLGAQKVLRTRDGGLQWEEVSPDLTGPGGGRGVVYTIAPSPVREGVVWAGTDDGRIQLTTNGGSSWRDVTPAGLAAWSKISLIDASSRDVGTAYAAVDRHRLDDFGAYIYRTHDSGAHWQRIDAGIPDGAFVRAVRADPEKNGLLYAGTERGVYVSFDDGAHWQSLQLDMPMSPVRDLAIVRGDLVAATHGRSFWILDDVSPLRQMQAAAAAASGELHLLRPRPAVRLSRSESHDTPLPPEEPQGENPPAGAIIDYWLSTGGGPVTLEVLAPSGAVIRRFSSEDTFRVAESQYFMDEWLPEPSALTRRPSRLNRFVWDLRYPPPPASSYDYSIAAIAGHGTVPEPQGPLVPPGEYTLRLTAGGRTDTQPLRVIRDPRVEVPDSVFRAQLALALDIWNAMADARALQQEIDSTAARLRALDGARLESTGRNALSAAGRAIAGLHPGAIGDAMASLEGAVQSADREPPRQVREAFQQMQAQLAAERSRWDALRDGDLSSLDARLKRRGLPPVTASRAEPRRTAAPWR